MDLVNAQKQIEYKPWTLVFYAPQGTGKSTIASQAPNVVFMDIEDGLGGIATVKFRMKTWQDVLNMITQLHSQPHKFGVLAVDTLDWLEVLIHKEICRQNRVANIDDIGYGKGYGMAISLWDVFLKGMTSLRENKGMCIILLAHSKVKTFNDPAGNSYDKYMLKLNDKAAAIVQEWADGVIFMNTKAIVVTEKGGFSEKKKAKDGGVYAYASGTPAYDAKNRAMLNLPDEFPLSKNNSWNDFCSQIGKGDQG